MVLVYAENDGAFLGMGAEWPYILKLAVFIAIPLAVCAFGLWYAVAKETGTGRAAIIATVVAGGIGNIQDRLLNNFNVVDFLNFGIGRLRTGILNVGDMSVTFGVIALAIAVSRAEKRDAGAAQGSPKGGRKSGKSS
jgi:signal peptidase II